MERADHRHALLTTGRCGRCAERVSRFAIIRGDACDHCGRTLGVDGSDVREELASRRLVWRLLGYGLVAAASFVSGLVPLGQFAVQLAALFILHVVVLRRSLLWLPPGRRILARITIKLLGAALACLALVINVAVAPLAGVSAAVLAAVGPLLTAVYIEGSLVILRRRLAWEAEERPVDIREWWLPVGLLVGLVVIVAAMAASIAGLVHLFGSLEVPSLAETSGWLMGWLP